MNFFKKGPGNWFHSVKDGKMQRDIAADMITFLGIKRSFDGSDETARKHNLKLVYDSKGISGSVGESIDFIDRMHSYSRRRSVEVYID